MNETSTKPYLLRALHEWCEDNGYTPHIAVRVGPYCRVPMAHVKDGQIVLNIGSLASQGLSMGNEFIEFQARFNGVAQQVSVPVAAVAAIYARETAEGMGFEAEEYVPSSDAQHNANGGGDAKIQPQPTLPLPLSDQDSIPTIGSGEDAAPPPKKRPHLYLVK